VTAYAPILPPPPPVTLTGGELAARFRHIGRHALSASFGKTAGQDRDQLGLRFGVKLLGDIQGVIQSDPFNHYDFLHFYHDTERPKRHASGSRSWLFVPKDFKWRRFRMDAYNPPKPRAAACKPARDGGFQNRNDTVTCAPPHS